MRKLLGIIFLLFIVFSFGVGKVDAAACDPGYYCPAARVIDEYFCLPIYDGTGGISSCYLDWERLTLPCGDGVSSCETRNVCSSNDCTPVYYGSTIASCDAGPTPCSPAGCCTLSGGPPPVPSPSSGGGSSPVPSPSPSPGCTPTNPGPVDCIAPNGVTLNYSTNVNLQWNWPGAVNWGDSCGVNANSFRVQWDDSSGFGTPNYNETWGSAFRNTFVNVTPGIPIYWRVRAENGVLNGAWTSCQFDTTAALSGTVYYSDGLSCSTDPANKINTYDPSATVQVEAFDGLTTLGVQNLVDSGYSYDVSAGSNYSVQISGWDTNTYSCESACGACPTRSSVGPTDSPIDFWLTDQNFNAWWSVAGGDIYSGTPNVGTTLQSLLPSGVSYFMSNDGSGTSPLAILRNSSATMYFKDPNPQVDYLSSGKQNSLGTTYSGDLYNFAFWKNHLGLPANPVSDDSDGTLEETSLSGGKEYYYVTSTGPTVTVTGTAWDVSGGESYIVFVDANLTINTDIITSNTDGFLMFIVNGVVTINSGVSDVQGIIVSDGSVTTVSAGANSDIPLNYEGSLITWSNVILNRDLASSGVGSNQDTPAEKFTYRPDLLRRMPDILKIFNVEWQELAPGSF